MTASLWFAVLMTGAVLSIYAARRMTPQRAGAAALMVGAAGLALARQFALAVPLALVGYSLWMRSTPRQSPSSGQTTRVRSAGLAMSLDHDTGEMDGEVLTGVFAGRRLSDLDGHDLQALLELFEADGDEESLALLLGYLERRGGGEEASETGGGGQNMARAQALRILGLDDGADLDAIRAAHRRLIKKVHPDLGGSNALAAMINEAKQVLDPDR